MGAQEEILSRREQLANTAGGQGAGLRVKATGHGGHSS